MMTDWEDMVWVWGVIVDVGSEGGSITTFSVVAVENGILRF